MAIISKLVPPLNGLISLLITCYILNGVVVTLLLVPISINMKLGGSYLKLGKAV
jgi:hypothetical protein